MGRSRTTVIVVAGLALAAGCGSGGAQAPPDTPVATASTAPSPSPSPSASASPTAPAQAAPSGSLKTTLDCAEVTPVAGLKKTNASPGTLCAFESDTDYVAFTVTRQQAPTFTAAQAVEQANSKGKIVIEQVPADGWTFGARWPADGAFTRVQRWLVDAQGQILLCKMGSDRGDAGITELVAVCEQAKAKLHTT